MNEDGTGIPGEMSSGTSRVLVPELQPSIIRPSRLRLLVAVFSSLSPTPVTAISHLFAETSHPQKGPAKLDLPIKSPQPI